jgi:Reverse transcriptase (RNA-dependent DNA polymerase)
VLLDKPRNIFYFEALDFVVHGVIADLLCDAIAPLLAPSVYSYRLGVSSWQAVREFAAYVRAHRKARPDVKQRGLYVFRADVHGYVESIPVGNASPLWPMLRAVLGRRCSERHFELVQSTLRPEIVGDDGATFTRCRGIPLGSPVATQALNLYLCDLDNRIAAFKGAFYVRFGDDILFAHEDPAVVQRAIALIREQLGRLGLELHGSKERLLWLNGAGRASSEWPEARGSQVVVFVGCEVKFDATIALPKDKARVVLTDLKQRVRRAANLMRGAPADERAAVICAIANQLLDPRSLFANKHAMRVRSMTTCRQQLAQLDYVIARTVAEAVTGWRGVRALRKMPPRALRERWKLVSLVAMRNAVR